MSFPSPNPRAPIQCRDRARANAFKRVKKCFKRQPILDSDRARICQVQGAAHPYVPSTHHSPPPVPYLHPHNQRRRSPFRPGLSREGSLTSPRPASTSTNPPNSAGAGSRNNQVRVWRQKGWGGRGEKRQERCPPLKTHCHQLPVRRNHQHKMATKSREPVLPRPSTY